MKLLILTQYFPPEVGAPQNRLFELAVRLTKMGVDVTVLTAMPNYPQMQVYEGYREHSYKYEEMSGLKVHRSSIFASQSKSIINRLRNYFSFVVSSIRTSSKLEASYDFLMCESPPLFLGYSALYISRKKKAKLVFNVSDLWPESAEKLGVVNNRFLLSMAYRLEAKLYRRATLITGQTQGICKNINERFKEVKTYWLPNGVDLSYYNPQTIEAGDWRKKNNFSQNDFIILYAGIVGIAQGLEVILNAAKQLENNTTLKFVILGSGPEKEKLQKLKKEMVLENVFFMEPVTKKEMPFVLKSINAAVVPLKKLDLFLGAIPSKLFENLAMEVPVLLGVDGEARELFINDGKCGIYFEPENATELAQAVFEIANKLDVATQLGKNGRNYVNAHFNRNQIANDFYQRLQQEKKS